MPCIQQEQNICTSIWDIKCVACYNLPWKCNNLPESVTTGNNPYVCHFGCPEDCERVDDVHCNTIYQCADNPDYLALCELVMVAPPFSWDWDCLANELGTTCYECIRDPLDPGIKNYEPSWNCD